MGTKVKKSKSNLSFGLRYGYGLGEFGMNFLLTYVTYFLTFFLTNVAGFSMVMAATVTTATTVIKCVGMPVSGVLVDSIRFKKSRFRQWAIIGSVIYWVGGTLLFAPLHLSEGGYAVLFCIFFLVYWLGYSITWTSFRALMDPICSTPIDKVGLTAAASQEGTIARVLFMVIATGILGVFASNMALGYTAVNFVFGLICVVCFFAVNHFVRKYDTIAVADASAEAAGKSKPKQKMSKKDFWNTIKTRPMLIFVLCIIFRCAVLSVLGTLLIYYLTYVLNNPGIASIYMMLVYALAFFGALLVQPLVKRIGKRNTFIYTTILASLCCFGQVFTGTSAVGFIILMCGYEFFSIFSSTLIPTCMADIGEYNSYVNGSQARGFTFSIGGMAIQISSVIGAAIASFGLVAVGFDPNNVTAAAVDGLRNLYIFGLAGLTLMSALLFLLYPLTEKYMDELRAQHAPKATAAAGDASAAPEAKAAEALDAADDADKAAASSGAADKK